MNKPLMYLDFETQSEVDIKTSGVYPYVKGINFQPACMAYAIDDGAVQIWKYGEDFPIDLMRRCQMVVFNLEFEYNVLKSRWFRKYSGIDTSWITYDHFIDVQAVGKLFGYPASLDKLAEVLGIPYRKDPKGTALINQLCKVKNNRILTYDHAPHKFEDLYDYCKQDVRVTRACHNTMIKKDLSPYERQVYIHMLEQNEYGFPIDIRSVRQIAKVLETYKENCNSEIWDLTKGEIQAGTQNVAIAKYIRNCNPKFSWVNSVAKSVVDDILENEKLDEHCRDLLRLRQKASFSSTAKFKRILDMIEEDERVRGNLKYYGGHTGRFAGVGIQIHNLPRAQVDDPQAVIDDFFALSIPELETKYGNVGEIASKLIRPMIMAHQGRTLCVADYVSIENVCLHWTANDKQTIKEFADRKDQYKTYAARRFNTTYDQVTKSQRTYAKPCVLGLGYGGGSAALQRVATGYGISLSSHEAEKDKKFYRKTFPMIPKLWKIVNRLMIQATQERTLIDYHTGTCKLTFIGKRNYSFIILPSGRFLAYPNPVIQEDYQHGDLCFAYEGIDSYTKKWRLLGDQTRKVDGHDQPDMVIHGGRLVENIIQAMARDLLVNGTLWAKRMDYDVLGSVHDEIIAELETETVTRNTLDHFCSTICILPKWAKGMPLKAEGYIDKRYRKD